ncbi:Zn-finger in Ran binding protein [Ancylostoma caninum]|uniref:Zn-finger in Ran binding protein n=1 Tax=Ancylostoma caninum TaxID=29170 RepID=A0A368FM45_ANCCA|nr:Zn-finger in Ran binding protein [Ancylostoma caninum]
MSSDNNGWLSAVSKLFTGGGQRSPYTSSERRSFELQESSRECTRANRDSVSSNGSPSYNSGPPRGLRYLSPSALDSGMSKPGVSKPVPAEDIFVGSTTVSRKRLLTQDDRPATAMDGLFNRDNPKRSRREHFGHSMLEGFSSRMFPDDFEASWLDRTVGGSSSCVDFAHSPCSSNRSLIGRIGSNRSNSSSLSSKTKAILSHLERINTPAREARKLPVMRGTTVPSERWAPMHIGGAPPLVRSSATVPSRIQLLSTSLASQRKPYWRDITRKAQEREKSSVTKDSGDSAEKTSVHPLFDLQDKTGRGESGQISKKVQDKGTSDSTTKTSVPSGENKDERKVGCNVFSADQLIDDQIDGTSENDSDKLVFAPPTKAAPSAGFTDDFVFSFAAPVERLPGQDVTSIAASEGKSGSESEAEESGSDESDEAQSSSASDSDKLVFAPPTKAAPSAGFTDDFVFSFAAPVERLPGQDLTSITGSEGKSGSESEAEESGSDESDDAQSSSASDVGESTASAKATKSSRPPTAADSETSAAVSSSITPLSSNDVSPQTKSESSWECPDCFITNKNVSVCAACGHNKDGSSATKTLVSNISTFGKSLPTTGIRFGVSSEKTSNGAPDQSNNADTASSKTSGFTFKTIEPASTAAAKPESSSAAPVTSQKQAATVAPTSTGTTKVGESDNQRKAWECPDCMVQNKATDDKCVCCGHVMYKSTSEQPSTASVFGDRAFKPAPKSSRFSFGFGGGSGGATTGTTVKFGLGNNAAKESTEVKESPSVTVIPPPKTAESAPAGQNIVASTETRKEAQPALLKTSSSPAFVTPVTKPEEKPQTSAFTLGAGTTLFGAGAKPPLFGSSSTSLFNTSSSTGSLLTSSTQPSTSPPSAVAASQAAPTTAPAPFTFGAAPAANAPKPFGLFETKKDDGAPASKPPAFGSGLTFGSIPNPSTQVSSTTTPGLASNTEASAGTGSSLGTGLFGATPNKPLFPSFGVSSDPPKPLFGSTTSATTEAPKPIIFGATQQPASEAPKPPLFGASAPATASKPIFGATAAPAVPPTANGGLSFNFGSNNAFGGFGATASTTPATVPSLSSSSSTTSLFGAAQPAPDTSKPFQFNATLPDTTFQFGQAPLAGPTPFQFGSSQSAAPAVPCQFIVFVKSPGSNLDIVRYEIFSSFRSNGYCSASSAKLQLCLYVKYHTKNGSSSATFAATEVMWSNCC